MVGRCELQTTFRQADPADLSPLRGFNLLSTHFLTPNL